MDSKGLFQEILGFRRGQWTLFGLKMGFVICKGVTELQGGQRTVHCLIVSRCLTTCTPPVHTTHREPRTVNRASRLAGLASGHAEPSALRSKHPGTSELGVPNTQRFWSCRLDQEKMHCAAALYLRFCCSTSVQARTGHVMTHAESKKESPYNPLKPS